MPIPQDLATTATKSPIKKIHRRSKYLLIDLANGITVIFHLGMSGRFFFTDKKTRRDKHDHVYFDTEDGLHLRLRDPRRFGLLTTCATVQLPEHKLFKNLGCEPLTSDFNAKFLHTLCRRTQTSIKSLLMNAKHVVGIGNIYANEALFLSGIKPSRVTQKITAQETAHLCPNIKHILNRSIELGGTTFRDYVDSDGKPGLHQLELFVYGREGQPCKNCQTPIKRIMQNNRSSFFCPRCQR
jgi:formamidopyrimidine-DNA glycosylase